jgi:methyl-accepting chemotaxis protein
MPTNWTFGRKLAFGFSIAVLTVLVIGLSGHRSTTSLIENNRLVIHTHEVQAQLASVLSQIVEIESSARGFAVTGNDAFLDSYRASLPGLENSTAALRGLTAENPNQQRRLAALSPLVNDKIQHMKRSIELRRAEGLDAAVQLISRGEGKQTMDSIRALAREMHDDAQRLLDARQAEADTSVRTAEHVILWGSVLGTLLVAGAGFLISRSLTLQIGVAVRHIQTSSAELQSAANQQATGAKEQSTAMHEITTTISELLATSRQIAESARKVSEIADQTALAARAGDVTVSHGHDQIGAIRRQVDLIVSHMLDLGKKSQQIGAVLDIVSELAEQTNILAINATIEAAGAGESGRRFGVVADEIRKLADRVGGSTKEIRGLIDDVRSAVNTTVMTTETGSKAVESGADQFAKVASSFRQISGQVATTTEASKEIELSTKQQASAVEQVNIAVTNVAQASKETEVSTGQTLRTASELSSLSRDLLRLIEPHIDAAPARSSS